MSALDPNILISFFPHTKFDSTVLIRNDLFYFFHDSSLSMELLTISHYDFINFTCCNMTSGSNTIIPTMTDYLVLNTLILRQYSNPRSHGSTLIRSNLLNLHLDTLNDIPTKSLSPNSQPEIIPKSTAIEDC